MYSQNKIVRWRKYVFLNQQNLTYNALDNDYEHEIQGNILANTLTLQQMSLTNEFPNITSTYSQFFVVVNNTTYVINIDAQFHN